MKMTDPDVLVLGAGVDGLVAAATLAKAGRTVVLVERRDCVGGRAVTEEFHPGFKVSSGLHSTGGMLPSIVENLRLEEHGLELLPEDRGVTTLREDAAPFHWPADRAKAQVVAAGLSERDGRGYRRLTELLSRLTPFLRPLLSLQPVAFERPTLGKLLAPAWQALRFRRLGEKDMLELLRIAPQSLFDFTEDWFESEVLRATLALPGLIGTNQGPWSPGTTTQLLLWEASSFGGPLSRGGLPKGGMGSISAALERCALRKGVVFLKGSPAEAILREDGRVCGVRLADGKVQRGRVVLSSLGPKRTFGQLLDVGALSPAVGKRLRHYRSEGCVAKVHFALGALPTFTGGDVDLGGRVQVGERLSDLERAFDDAKYGRLSARPFMDIAFPSVLDSSLAPSGKHVCSVLLQYAPYTLADGNWHDMRDQVGDLVQRRIEEFAPGFGDSVLGREVLTPVDLEERLGIDGGHLLGGDLSLDQLFTNRPVSECGSYQTPVDGLFLTGSGTHPGGYLTGAAGANAAKRILKDWRGRAD
jgi:phytoene dehydrogenase-like protein